MEKLGERSFAAVTDTIRAARRFVRENGESVAIKGTQISDIELVASELVSNAIEHGSGAEYSVVIAVDHDDFMIEVSSLYAGPGVAEPSGWEAPNSEALSGRGLGLVRSLSTKTWVIHEDGFATLGCKFKV